MILGIHVALRSTAINGALAAVRFEESFAPIAADYVGGGDLPEHYVAACPEPLVRIVAPDSWTIERSPMGHGQVLKDPSRPALSITPSVALILAHAGREGFSLALDTPPGRPPGAPPGRPASPPPPPAAPATPDDTASPTP